METFSALLTRCEGNSPVTGEFPSKMLVIRGFDVFFDLCLQIIKKTIETPVIWDVTGLIMTAL